MTLKEIKKQVYYHPDKVFKELDGDSAKKMLEKIWDETYELDGTTNSLRMDSRTSKWVLVMKAFRQRFRARLVYALCLKHEPEATNEEMKQVFRNAGEL